jgi:hypothetical protein
LYGKPLTLPQKVEEIHFGHIISAFLAFVLTDVTVYPAAVPLFNRA